MASPGSQAASRTDQGSRGQSSSGGKSSGSSGGSGHQAAISQASVGAAPSAATTSYGAPVHTSTGPVYGGIQAAKSPAAWGALNNQVNTYNDAARRWNASAQTPSIGNLLNGIAPGGFSMQAPDFAKPKTYVGGDYHLGMNPAAFAGGLLGAAIPGAGTVAGPALGGIYSALGGSNVMLGGGPVPGNWGMNGAPAAAAQMAAMGSPGGGNMPSSQQNAGRQNSAGDHLQQLAQLNSGIPGNPGAPVNSGTATPGTPGAFGMPGLQGPNYSQMLARTQSITPNYGVQLPGYQYANRIGAATV